MRFIIDTHVWLWSLTAPERMSESARATLEDGSNRPILSMASIWEVAIKTSLGKLKLPTSSGEYLPTLVSHSGMDVLGIALPHVLEVARLPWIHRDPFDRMLVAQARAEGVPVMTSDRKLSAYEIETLGC